MILVSSMGTEYRLNKIWNGGTVLRTLFIEAFAPGAVLKQCSGNILWSLSPGFPALR